VAHTCNLSYSGGRDQFDSNPARANNSQDLNLKKPFTKIGLVEWLKVKALSSSPSTAKKKETKQNPETLHPLNTNSPFPSPSLWQQPVHFLSVPILLL
jgi:hypothetical protein